MPTIKQARSIRGVNITSASGSFRVTPTAGNMVAVLVGGWDSGGFTISSLTDNQGNTYTKRAEPASSVNSSRCSIWTCENIAASGTFTITITSSSAGSYIEATMIEVEGADTSASTDVTATATGTNTSTDANVTAGGNIAQANELWLACCTIGITSSTNVGLETPTNVGWFNIRRNQNFSGNVAFSADYYVSGAVATPAVQYSHNATTGASNGWTCALLTIKGTFEDANWLEPPALATDGAMVEMYSFDDCDTATLAPYVAHTNTLNTIVTTGGARNSGRLRLTSTGAPRTRIQLRNRTAYPVCMVAFWIKVDTLSGISTDTWNNAIALLYFLNATATPNYIAHLGLNADRRLYWRCESNFHALISQAQLTLGDEYYVEVRVDFGASPVDGNVAFYINGVLDSSAVGVQTCQSDGPSTGEIDVLYAASPGGTADISLDDLSIWEDGTTSGESWLAGPLCDATDDASRWPHVFTFFPDADVSATNWTPSIGADHFAVVDEAATDTADYTSTTTNAARLTLGVTVDGVANGTIAAVAHRAYVRTLSSKGVDVGIRDTVNAVDMEFQFPGPTATGDYLVRTSRSDKSPLTRQWTYEEMAAAQLYVEPAGTSVNVRDYRSVYLVMAYGAPPPGDAVPIWALTNHLRSHHGV